MEMEMEILDTRNSPAEAMDRDGMWEDEEENGVGRRWRGDVPCELA
jgi:hypothetical protein